uniref:Uncharacterized protein n=1 Tax=Nelumbo nucifera TaxID=4432 RepID=A0A822XP46_NELNU|nr:TPA_asm: hypothetical protein HUJ06_022444 [Nelumbo nucifera]
MIVEHTRVSWSNKETHTFVLAHREVTVTLEDIVQLMCLPIRGSTNPLLISLSNEEKQIEVGLNNLLNQSMNDIVPERCGGKKLFKHNFACFIHWMWGRHSRPNEVDLAGLNG